MKAKYKKSKENWESRIKTIYLELKEAYEETKSDEYIRTGIPSQMTFTNFLIMNMNYPYNEAVEITECYQKWKDMFEK